MGFSPVPNGAARACAMKLRVCIREQTTLKNALLTVGGVTKELSSVRGAPGRDVSEASCQFKKKLIQNIIHVGL